MTLPTFNAEPVNPSVTIIIHAVTCLRPRTYITVTCDDRVQPPTHSLSRPTCTCRCVRLIHEMNDVLCIYHTRKLIFTHTYEVAIRRARCSQKEDDKGPTGHASVRHGSY